MVKDSEKKKIKLEILNQLKDSLGETAELVNEELMSGWYKDTILADKDLRMISKGQNEAFEIVENTIDDEIRKIKLKRKFVFETENTEIDEKDIIKALVNAKIFGDVKKLRD